ncbi:probable glutamate receptor isoform X2 [Panulirus ornatus]
MEPVHLRVAAEEFQPYTEVTHDPTTGATLLKGPTINILQALASSLNFTYSLIHGDGFLGAPLPNGSWDGVMGMLQRQEVDLALGPLALTPQRAEVVDFTQPFFLEKMRLLQARPTSTPDPWGLLTPFSVVVWVCIAVSFVAVVVAVAATVLCLGRGEPSHPADHLLAVASVLIGQALPWIPKGLAVRVALGTWMLSVIIIANSYSGSLTSLLTVRELSAKYDSLRQVVDDPDVTILLEGSTAFSAYLETAQKGIFLEVRRATEQRGRFLLAKDLWRSLHLLQDGRHVMLIDEETGKKFTSDYFSMTGECDHYVSRDVFFNMILAMAVPKGSPLLQLLDHRIRMVREYGLCRTWILRQIYNVSHCLEPLAKDTSLIPYTLTHLWGAFLLLGCGLSLASLIFCWDVLCFRARSAAAEEKYQLKIQWT